MIVDQIDLPVHRQGYFLSARFLGTLGMIAAPMLLLEGLYRHLAHLADNQSNQIVGVLGSIYICGWLCSAIGMRGLRVTGGSMWSTLIFAVQVAGLLLAGLWSIQEIVQLHSIAGSLLFNITDAAWPLSHLFMLVVGGFVLKAGVWRGWQRFAPLLCGLALPAFFAAVAVGARELGILLFAVLTTVGFMLLGSAVRTSRRAVLIS